MKKTRCTDQSQFLRGREAGFLFKHDLFSVDTVVLKLIRKQQFAGNFRQIKIFQRELTYAAV